MKQTIVLLTILLLFGHFATAQESRRQQRKIREKEKAAEILSLIGKQEFRFVAQFAYPMGGSSIHLTSEYTLDIQGDTATAWLPFYGRAYRVDYGGRDGGIKFSEDATSFDWKKTRHGQQASIAVKAPKDLYNLTLDITSNGSASLTIHSNNRQTIRYSGFIVKIPEKK